MHTATLDNYSNKLLGTFKPSQYHKSEVKEKCDSVEAVIERTQKSNNKTEVVLRKKEFNLKTLTDILSFTTNLFANNNLRDYNAHKASRVSNNIDFEIGNYFDFILETINSGISESLQAERATIFIYDEEKRELWSKVAQSSNKDESLEIRISVDKCIAGEVAKTGKTLNIPDAYKSPLFNSKIDKQLKYKTKNVLCVPFVNSKQQIIGVI